jgi:tight adherence protein B
MIELVAAMMGALAVFVAVGALTGQFGRSQRKIAARAVTLQRHGMDVNTEPAGSVLLKEDSLAGNEQVSRFLGRLQWAESRARLLDTANLPLKVSEYILLLGVIAGGLALVTMLLSGYWLVGLGFAVASFFIVESWVESRAKRRLNTFNSQLPIALQTMSTSLKSGFGVMEAVSTVTREMDDPIKGEFQRVLDEARVGGSFESGLQSMVERVGSQDLKIAARALEVHRKVGGDLAEILDQVSATMRERDELRGHVRSMTAQQRAGGMIVGLLPLYVVGLFSIFDPEFISPLWERETGRLLLGIAAAMEATAFVAMRKIMAIEV